MANLVHTRKVNATAAALLAEHMLHSYESPPTIARNLGVLQSQDPQQIDHWVEQALAANQRAVRDALNHPKKRQAARGFLTGQVMKISAAQADPRIVAQLLERRLREIAEQP